MSSALVKITPSAYSTVIDDVLEAMRNDDRVSGAGFMWKVEMGGDHDLAAATVNAHIRGVHNVGGDYLTTKVLAAPPGSKSLYLYWDERAQMKRPLQVPSTQGDPTYSDLANADAFASTFFAAVDYHAARGLDEEGTAYRPPMSSDYKHFLCDAMDCIGDCRGDGCYNLPHGEGGASGGGAAAQGPPPALDLHAIARGMVGGAADSAEPITSPRLTRVRGGTVVESPLASSARAGGGGGAEGAGAGGGGGAAVMYATDEGVSASWTPSRATKIATAYTRGKALPDDARVRAWRANFAAGGAPLGGEDLRGIVANHVCAKYQLALGAVVLGVDAAMTATSLHSHPALSAELVEQGWGVRAPIVHALSLLLQVSHSDAFVEVVRLSTGLIYGTIQVHCAPDSACAHLRVLSRYLGVLCVVANNMVGFTPTNDMGYFPETCYAYCKKNAARTDSSDAFAHVEAINGDWVTTNFSSGVKVVCVVASSTIDSYRFIVASTVQMAREAGRTGRGSGGGRMGMDMSAAASELRHDLLLVADGMRTFHHASGLIPLDKDGNDARPQEAKQWTTAINALPMIRAIKADPLGASIAIYDLVGAACEVQRTVLGADEHAAASAGTVRRAGGPSGGFGSAARSARPSRGRGGSRHEF